MLDFQVILKAVGKRCHENHLRIRIVRLQPIHQFIQIPPEGSPFTLRGISEFHQACTELVICAAHYKNDIAVLRDFLVAVYEGVRPVSPDRRASYSQIIYFSGIQRFLQDMGIGKLLIIIQIIQVYGLGNAVAQTGYFDIRKINVVS